NPGLIRDSSESAGIGTCQQKSRAIESLVRGNNVAVSDSAIGESQTFTHSGKVINDFNIQVATVNGSGSQTANTVLLRAIFQMGIPVSGKNLFPSNIMGLPTWY